MRFRNALATFALVPLLFVSAACEDDAEVQQESADPIVGIMELPISRRSGDPAPNNPLRIEVSPERLRLDAHTLVELQNGRVPASEQSNGAVTKLKNAIQSGAARSAATLRIHVNVPYETTAMVLKSLRDANVRQAGFEVRKGSGAETGWLVIDDFRVEPPSQEPVEFPGASQVMWDDFARAWESMYTACRMALYVDCNPKAIVVAEGGKALLTLWARGNGLKIDVTRFGGPDATPAPQRIEMLEGIPQPAAEGEEEPIPPATHAAFTWRAEAATTDAPPISGAMRPLCGARQCGAVVQAEGQTMTMRIVSFLGAAFPDGTPSPKVVFTVEQQ